MKIKFTGAAGDVIAMTAAVRDFRRQHPDQQVSVETPFPEVFAHNPYVQFRDNDSLCIEITESDYRNGVEETNRGRRRHFIEFFHHEIERKTGLRCQLLEPRPSLKLSHQHEVNRPVLGRYWVMFAGGKSDITLKHWSYDRYAQLAVRLHNSGINVVQTGRARDVHPPLPSVMNLVGWGGLRELFWLIRHSEGVICPITCGMHIAAAFGKPCVVLAGGRETPCWEAYNNDFHGFSLPIATPHRYLQSVGKLDCCLSRGCWLKQVSECHHPVVELGQPVLPLCMHDITVEAVLDAVGSYYQDGILRMAAEPEQLKFVGDCPSGMCNKKPLSEGELNAVQALARKVLEREGLLKPQEHADLAPATLPDRNSVT